MQLEQALERLPRQDEEHGVEGDACGHRPALAGKQDRLAERLPRPVARDHLFPIEHVNGPRNDQVESVGFVARPVDRRVLDERDLAKQCGDLLTLRLAESAKRREREDGLLAAWTQHVPSGRQRRRVRTRRSRSCRCRGPAAGP
jgi:hypothetical protein